MRILLFQDENGLLKRFCQSRPFGADLMGALAQKASLENEPTHLLLPQQWAHANPQINALDVLTYQGTVWQIPDSIIDSKADEMSLLNGQVVFTIDHQRLRQTLDALSWQVATVCVTPHLQASKETLKLTSEANVVGFRRFYNASIEPTTPPQKWPDLIIFKRQAWDAICAGRHLPLAVDQLQRQIDQQRLQVIHLRAGGQIRSLDTESALLDCFSENCPADPNGDKVADRSVGPIFTGENVIIEPNVTLIGPVVLSNNVHIKSGAVVRRSMVLENTTIEADQVVNNGVFVADTDVRKAESAGDLTAVEERPNRADEEYKNWPIYSYARFGKRVFDIVASSLVLILLIPVFAIVTVAVKLTSPGPLFYRACRQGLHGRDFNCLKFRSMMVAADAMQERLRVVNQVDGPQFKMDNDPRITGVGKFLRDTYIDELPQFLNVFFGQMSIVGPRPSPENENESSPAWRDARLSVRPGITGLWQVLRTRQEGADFQEWVFHDTRYVQILSFRTDLWICWKTAQKLIGSFLGQFG